MPHRSYSDENGGYKDKVPVPIALFFCKQSEASFVRLVRSSRSFVSFVCICLLSVSRRARNWFGE